MFWKRKKANEELETSEETIVIDHEEEDGTEDAEGLSFPSLLDNALNDGIEFEKDHFKLQTGLGITKFGRSFFVKPSGYPRTVRLNWLEGFFTGDDMDCAVHIEPFDRAEAARKLKKNVEKLEAILDSAIKNDNGPRAEETQQKLLDVKFLQNQIRNNQNGLYYVSVQGSVFADSLDDLNDKCVSLEKTVKAEGIEIINAYGRQEKGWLSTLPLGRNYLEKSERNLDQQALTAIFPHSSSRLNHTGGMPIGVFGNEYVYYNNFDKKLNNYNVGIFGESGAGKGVFVKQLIGRGFMDGISKVAIIDVEPEYTEITKALGGVVIEIRSNTDYTSRINPLDVYVEREIKNKNTPDEYIIEKINVNEKIKEVMEFFKVMKEAIHKDHSILTATELGTLNDILEKLYADRGINEDPDSIFEQVQVVDESGNIAFKRRYIDMPTISDVYKELELASKTLPELQEFCKVVKLFTNGKTFGLFDGQTKLISDSEIMLDEAPVVTFDISKLSGNSIERPLAQHVLMTWIWNRFIKNDPKTKKRVVQDEAWMMIEYKSMMEFFKTLSARGRKWNVSLTLVSQRYQMFHRSPEASDVVAQLGTVAFMKQSDQDIEPILDTFRFSEDVGQMIRTGDTGDVILKAGKEIVSFRSEPTPDEWVYLNTNQNIEVDSIRDISKQVS